MKLDEKWEDPSGNSWRVSEVRRIDRDGSDEIAYVWVRHISGVTAKLMPDEIATWKRTGLDPLEGHRRQIQNGHGRIVYSADKPCPVDKGERFYLRGCDVTVDSVTRKIVKGRTAEWHVELFRREADPVYLLRSAPPARADHSRDANLDAEAIAKAAVDSAYTASPVSAMDHEPESVGPEWIDQGQPARELARQEARRERVDATMRDAQIDRAAATLKQVSRTIAAKGHDPAAMLDDVIARVAAEEARAA